MSSVFAVASLGDHGLIMVLFETPSGFAIFSIDGTPLSRPDAIEVLGSSFIC
jgi:nucleolar protein 58